MTADQPLTTFLKPDDAKLMIAVADLKPDPNQPRKHFPRDRLEQLGASLLLGQELPLLVDDGNQLVDGGCRLQAAKLVGITHLWAVRVGKSLDATERTVAQLKIDIHRDGLKPAEVWQALVKIMKDNPGLKQKDLARLVSMSEVQVSRYLSPSNATPRWQQAFIDGPVTLSDIIAASQLPLEQQDVMLEQKLNGAKVGEEVRRMRRAKADSDNPTVKLSRVPIHLPSGIRIVVTGPQLDLDALIEHLSSAKTLAVSSKKKGICVETSIQYWEDLAKAEA